MVFQSLWICLVNPIPASTTSVSLFSLILLAYLSPAVAPSAASCAVSPQTTLNSCWSTSQILETHAQELWPGQRDHCTTFCHLDGDLSPDGPPLRRAESRPNHSPGSSTTLASRLLCEPIKVGIQNRAREPGFESDTHPKPAPVSTGQTNKYV